MALLLSACSPTNDSSLIAQSPENKSQAVANDHAPNSRLVSLALLPETRAGDAAALIGRLFVEDGCVYVETSDKKLTLLAFTAPGARWSGMDEALVVDGQLIRHGDNVLVGGSNILDLRILDGKWRSPISEHCNKSRVWIANIISLSGG
jgi:hypothetical protein